MALHKKTPLKNITFKGANYKLADGADLPVPEFSPELAPSEENIYVRMSMDDYQLLASLPESTYGPVKRLLSRFNRKKLESGRAEVMATETEVADVIAALEDFIDEEEGAAASTVHAQDMLAKWKRNYLMPDKPLPKPMPSYTSDLPRSTNVRVFNYKGAKYVLVEADDTPPDYMKKRESPTYEEVIDQEIFSDLVKNIKPSIRDNIPVSQLKRSVDAVQQAEGSLRKASDALNNDRRPGVRWLTDAFFSGNQGILNKLMEDPELVRTSINQYIEDLQTALAAAQTAVTVITDISNMVEEKDWASKWTMKKRRSELRKEILEKAYGMSAQEIKDFFSEAYAIKQKRSEEKKPEKQATASTVPRTVKFKGHPYVLVA